MYIYIYKTNFTTLDPCSFTVTIGIRPQEDSLSGVEASHKVPEAYKDMLYIVMDKTYLTWLTY